MSTALAPSGLRPWLHASFQGSQEYGSPWVGRAVVGAVLLSSLLVMLETEEALWATPVVAAFFDVLDPLLLGFFAIEYTLRLWAAGEEPAYAGWQGRLKWMGGSWQLFDLGLILVFFLPFFGPEVFVLRLLRLGRILAILRLGRLTAAGQMLVSCIFERRYDLCVSFLAALLLMIVAAVGLYLIEGDQQPDAFGSVRRALWWSMATLTTVGYGDVYPVTPPGKLLAGVVAFIGIGVIAIPTGIVAGAFSNALSRPPEEAISSPDAGTTGEVSRGR